MISKLIYCTATIKVLKNSTTDLAINQIVEELIEAGQKKVKFYVFFDFAKAFNTVNHKILVSKLKSHNIICLMLSFVESYLKLRRQLLL